jgi:hypothetical protein
MANAKTEHSRKLRRQSARESLARAIAEGRIKRKMLQAPTEIMDAFLAHMDATGGRTDAEKLRIINEMLDNLQEAKNNS